MRYTVSRPTLVSELKREPFMSRRDDRVHLTETHRAVSTALATAERHGYEGFQTDPDVQDVLAFRLFRIGEAANTLSASLRDQYADVPWR